MDTKKIAMMVCLLAAACGSAQDDSAAVEPTSYAQMNFSQRAVFMTEVVVPQMTEIFVAFDPKFANLSCTTCHGSGATNGTFTMPSTQVPPLPGSEEAFFEYIKDPEKARWSQFMLDQVWPKMAALLQVEPYNPTSQPNGFSCSNCHTHMGAAH